MKHIIVILVVSAFTMSVAFAGEECCKAKSACDAKAKAEKLAKAAKADGSTKGAQQLVKK